MSKMVCRVIKPQVKLAFKIWSDLPKRNFIVPSQSRGTVIGKLDETKTWSCSLLYFVKRQSSLLRYFCAYSFRLFIELILLLLFSSLLRFSNSFLLYSFVTFLKCNFRTLKRRTFCCSLTEQIYSEMIRTCLM